MVVAVESWDSQTHSFHECGQAKCGSDRSFFAVEAMADCMPLAMQSLDLSIDDGVPASSSSCRWKCQRTFASDRGWSCPTGGWNVFGVIEVVPVESTVARSDSGAAAVVAVEEDDPSWPSGSDALSVVSDCGARMESERERDAHCEAGRTGQQMETAGQSHGSADAHLASSPNVHRRVCTAAASEEEGSEAALIPDFAPVVAVEERDTVHHQERVMKSAEASDLYSAAGLVARSMLKADRTVVSPGPVVGVHSQVPHQHMRHSALGRESPAARSLYWRPEESSVIRSMTSSPARLPPHRSSMPISPW